MNRPVFPSLQQLPGLRMITTKNPCFRKGVTIRPPFPWATDMCCEVHTLNYLLSEEIHSIKGDVRCKKCKTKYEMEFNLRDKFEELVSFISENKAEMNERAPHVWMNPTLPTCRYCNEENSARPVINELGMSKKAINWLFMLLGQTLGCCNSNLLTYFCIHTKTPRRLDYPKDRLLYLTYLTLCNQLHPNSPAFHL